jgi:hypothetical protein
MKLHPVSFKWKSNDDEDIGFIAEEVERVDPVLAEHNKGKLSGVKYSQMSALLTKSVQELKVDNDNLRAQLAALQRRMNKMEAARK